MTIKLSKSKFVAGCQCLKRFYLQVHEPELAAEPDGTADAIIEQGREVGILARQVFPGAVPAHRRIVHDQDTALRQHGLHSQIRPQRFSLAPWPWPSAPS